MRSKLEEESSKKHFRVAIFGSARIKKGDPNYEQICTLAKMISRAGMDVVTGEGSGLMNAAGEGYHAERESTGTHSVELRIKLPAEGQRSRTL